MALINLYNKAVSEGTNYKTGNLLSDLDLNFADIVQAKKYPFQFANANLTAGTLTVTHNLSSKFILPVIKRPDNGYEIAWGFLEYVTDNQSKLNFGGSIALGTWEALFIAI
jgi:hypothetical protein